MERLASQDSILLSFTELFIVRKGSTLSELLVNGDRGYPRLEKEFHCEKDIEELKCRSCLSFCLWEKIKTSIPLPTDVKTPFLL